jgi:hypothetical protein
MLQVETAHYAEKKALDDKETILVEALKPDTLCGDDAYTQALRIRRWAQDDVILLAPALRWKNGRYAQAYRRFIKESDMHTLLRAKPVFESRPKKE